MVPTFSELKDVTQIKFAKESRECRYHGKYTSDVTIFPSGDKRFTPCPICSKERAEQDAKYEHEQLIKKYRTYNVEPEYINKTFDDFIPQTESQKKAKAAVLKMIEQKHGKIIILGSNGVGKTLLGNLAVMAMGGKIYTMYEISTMIRQAYSPLAKKSELEIVTELSSSDIPLLVIDEFGRTKDSEFNQNWLSFVLDRRHTRGLPFILLGNGHFKKYCEEGGCSKCFENFVDNDILSRLRVDSTIILINDAPDARKVKIAEGN